MNMNINNDFFEELNIIFMQRYSYSYRKTFDILILILEIKNRV